MKIWIVYDSKYGNNKQIAHKFEDNFKVDHEVHVHSVKEISPKSVANSKPDIFLFGGPRRMGWISFTLQRWIKRYVKILRSRNIRMKKIGAWETHGDFKEEDQHPESGMERRMMERNLNIGSKWIELIQQIPTEQSPPDLLDFTVKGMEGPLETGADAKVTEFATKFR